MGSDGSKVFTPKPASGTLSHGLAGASITTVHGPAGTAVYGPAGAFSPPIYAPVANANVYEANNEPFAPSELYAPHTTRY